MTMMLPNYEGYESLDQFPDQESLEKYRDSLIEKTTQQADFIERHTTPYSVLEIGSGNGRLLVSLAKRGVLASGLGLDLSQSRTAFARRWAADWGLHDLWFFTDDVLRRKPTVNCALVVCITGCIQYFTPLTDVGRVLKYMRASGRQALFELYKRPKEMSKVVRLGPADRWFAIYSSYYPTDHPSSLLHRKTFVGRDGSQDVREETLWYYTLPEFLDLLKTHGFGKVHVARENSESMVVLVS
jgi:SAM-dependent methyltransferase